MEQLFEDKAVFFGAGFILLISSIVLYTVQKQKAAISFLLLASFLFFLYSALKIPFLTLWDDRFHALVAKNLMNHPFIPTLYDKELLKLPYIWVQVHIWVHTQPLFLWQSALCYKLFGVNEIAFRLPGILLSTIAVFAGYRVGKLLGNNDIGYCIAILMATSFYLYRLISGIAGGQNDLVFMTYIFLSIWAMIEYLFSGRLYWIMLTGLFSGFAILTKWLAGLLVYLIWFLYTLLKHRLNFKKYIPIFLSLLITIIVFVPWQLYIFKYYPTEAQREFQHNILHFTSVLEGHDGSLSYHFNLLGMMYGIAVPYILIPALIIFYVKSPDRKLSLSLIISSLFVYIFFSIAKTKMESFTSIVALPMYLFIAFFIAFIVDWVAKKTKIAPKYKIAIFTLTFLSLAIFRLNFDVLKRNNGISDQDLYCYSRLSHNKQVFQKLKLPDNAVLCNIPGMHSIEAMFYTNWPAYGFIPDEDQYAELCKQGKIIALFPPFNKGIPNYLKKDPAVIVIKDSLDAGCE